jgi:hypothetical protein
MTIYNGTNRTDVNFQPAAGGGVQAQSMTDPNTGAVFQRSPAGGWTVPGAGGPGMSFNDAQAGIQGQQAQQTLNLNRGFLPSNMQAGMDQILQGMPPDIRNTPGARGMAMEQMNKQVGQNQDWAKIGLGQGELDIKNRGLTEATDPMKVLRQQAAIAIGHAPDKANEILQGMNTAMESKMGQRVLGGGVGPMPGVGPAAPGVGGLAQPGVSQAPGQLPPTTLAGANPGATPRNKFDLQNEQDAAFGPELSASVRENPTIANGTATFPTSTAALLQQAYVYDQQHPGFMQQHGKALLAAIRQRRGINSPEETAGAMGKTYGVLGYPLLGDTTPEDKAGGAWRDALGMKNGLLGSRGSGFLK